MMGLGAELNEGVFRLSGVIGFRGLTVRLLCSRRICPGCVREQLSLNQRLVTAGESVGPGPHPGDDELPGILVVGVNPLPQQGNEAHQVKLVALRHDVLRIKGT